MANRVRDEALQAILEAVGCHPEGAASPQIVEGLAVRPPLRTLQHRLGILVSSGRLLKEGQGRWARYRLPPVDGRMHVILPAPELSATGTFTFPLSKAGDEIREYVSRPVAMRRPAGYDRSFLDRYTPNETFYLPAEDRARLHAIGRPQTGEMPAGTYAKQILGRILIDLSWNSSRLEGNNYSRLDTKQLIDLGKAAEGKDRREAQMILNHKDAIEFLVEQAPEIGFDRYTICNLHAMLANNLLPNPEATGRVRHIDVGIEGSVFHPLAVPQSIEECFDTLLAKASAIADPFERAFFAKVHIPYLQPFDDVNKRVSRLAANVPLIQQNLAPLSFEGVPRGIYNDAMLGVYERTRIELLRDVFLWAYERSAASYAAVRQSLGEPDPFRLRHRESLREVVGAVVRGAMDIGRATAHVNAWAREHVDERDRDQFVQAAERDLLDLHEGNFARYRIRPSEFAAWRQAWSR